MQQARTTPQRVQIRLGHAFLVPFVRTTPPWPLTALLLTCNAKQVLMAIVPARAPAPHAALEPATPSAAHLRPLPACPAPLELMRMSAVVRFVHIVARQR